MRIAVIALIVVIAGVVIWVAVSGRPDAQAKPPEGESPSSSSPAEGSPEPAAGGPPGMQASPVRYTEAREHPVGRLLQLSGSVESPVTSVVASEVEGLMERQDAREGDTVRKGQPLAHLRTDTLRLQLQSFEAQLQEAESRHNQAQSNLTRVRDLAASEVVSRQELDNATYEASAWQGRVDSLKAQIERIRLDLARSAIRAPFTGRVVAELSEVGQWIAVGGPVAELMSLEDMEVRVEVPERYFGSLRPGGEAAVTFPSVEGLEATGRITAVVPRADEAARTFPLKIQLAVEDGRIGAGMLAQVSFMTGESLESLIVPKDAVVSQGQERFVYRLEHDGTARMIPVTPGQGVGEWIAVEGDLKAGDKVITRGNERLQPGMPVKGEPMEYALP